MAGDNMNKKKRAPKTYEYLVIESFRFYVIDKYIEGTVGDSIRVTKDQHLILNNYLEKK